MYDVLVIGAGQAGLAAGYYLQRSGLTFLIVDAACQAKVKLQITLKTTLNK